MNLYIMRHGQTDWNLEYRLQGQTNIDLNEAGIEMAKEASKKYKDLEIDLIYSSPLNRAYDTAKYVRGSRNIEIIKDDRLMEVGFGPYEGTTSKDRDETSGINLFFEDPENYVPKGNAESIDSLISRTKAFLEEVIYPYAKKHPKGSLLIVGHGAMNKALFLNLRKLPKKELWNSTVQNNCEIETFEI